MADVRVDIDWSRIERRLSGNVDKAQQMIDIQVLKDSTPYVPFETGALADTGPTNTDFGSGEVVWANDYARRQYYEFPNKAHDAHPLAVMRWFEAAKAVHKSRWLKLAKRIGGKR